jgi:hypothetical protein
MDKITEQRKQLIQNAVTEYVNGSSSISVCKKYGIGKKTLSKNIKESGNSIRGRAEAAALQYNVSHATQDVDGNWVKICRECKKEKSVLLFKKAPDYADGRVPVCNECRNVGRRLWDNERYANDPEYRERCIANSNKRYHSNPEPMKILHRKTKYNITTEEFLEKLNNQNHKCGACETDTPGVKGKTWCIDHDHSCCDDKKKTCGKCVRGILCHQCNFILGLAKDNKYTLLGLINYLDKYPKINPI